VGGGQTTGLDTSVLPGLEINNFGYYDQYSPTLNIGPAGVPGSFVDMGYYQNRLNPSTTVIFTAGKHTIVAGGGYSYTQLNITNNRTGHADVVVNGFDSFLQGMCASRLSLRVSTRLPTATMPIATIAPMDQRLCAGQVADAEQPEHHGRCPL